MKSRIVSQVIFEVLPNNAIEQYITELENLVRLLAEHQDLGEILNDPTVLYTEKMNVLKKLTKGLFLGSELESLWSAILKNKSRQNIILFSQELLEIVKKQYFKLNEIECFDLYVAPTTEQQYIDDIQAKLQNKYKKVVLNIIKSDDITLGYQLVGNNFLIDETIDTKLSTF